MYLFSESDSNSKGENKVKMLRFTHFLKAILELLTALIQLPFYCYSISTSDTLREKVGDEFIRATYFKVTTYNSPCCKNTMEFYLFPRDMLVLGTIIPSRNAFLLRKAK